METNNTFTAERSLQLISEMIEKNRKDLEKNAGNPMILWGSVVAVISCIVWILLGETGNHAWNFLFFAIPVIGYPLYYLTSRNAEKRARTYLDKIIGWVWIVFGTVSVLISVTAVTLVGPAVPFLTPMNVLALGLCTSITGFTLDSKVIGISGVIVSVAAPVLCFVFDGHAFPLILAGASLIGLIIPGIIINIQKK